MRLRFLGGADTVTGSQHLVEVDGHQVLRDCGLFQGSRKEANLINREFLAPPGELDALLLSHAHIDHCGNIPSLNRYGYAQPIYATRATIDLCHIMLRDAAHIQEQDAAYLNQKTNRAGLPPIEPLYTMQDAEAMLPLFREAPYHRVFEPVPGLEVESLEAGHILGAALTRMTVRKNGTRLRIGFAVDLGRHNLPIIRDPEPMGEVDVLVLESTYGNRLHAEAVGAETQLENIVLKTYRRGGKIIIPSFALERAQELLYHLGSLFGSRRIPEMPVFVDSPMAAAVSRVFSDNHDYTDEEFKALGKKIGAVMRAPWVHYTATVEDSKRVTAFDQPCIVISASGMCEHGRILHHLKQAVGNPRNSIVIVGWQAPHTLGRRLVERQKEIRIFGDLYELKAEVAVLNAFSGHADRNDLIEYARAARPGKTFLVHGDTEPRQALAEALRAAGLAEVYTPARGDTVEL